MSAATGISWTDSTFNPWIGCTKVSPACDHCYAERDTKRFGRVRWGAGQPRVRTVPANWKHPERWNRQQFVQCTGCGWRGVPDERFEESGCPECGPDAACDEARRRVFSASLGDWLDNEVPIEWLVDFLDLVRRTPNLDWLLLTKRIGNWQSRVGKAMHHVANLPGTEERMLLAAWIAAWLNGTPPPNVWVMATVENQKRADEDVPKLLRVTAVVRGLSIEPMLEPIKFHLLREYAQFTASNTGIHWIICGGESGPHARPMHPDWARSLRDQCLAAGVPFHFKQWGEWEPRTEWSGHLGGGRFETMRALMSDGSECPHDAVPQNVGAHRMAKVGKQRAGRLLDGREWNEFPRSAA